MGLNYKVRGKEICLVSWVMGCMVFVINIYKILEILEGCIVIYYNVIFCNFKINEVIRELEFEDFYEKFVYYYIMIS